MGGMVTDTNEPAEPSSNGSTPRRSTRLHTNGTRRRTIDYSSDVLDDGISEDRSIPQSRADRRAVQPRVPTSNSNGETSDSDSDNVARTRAGRRRSNRKHLVSDAESAAQASTSQGNLFTPTEWILATHPSTVPYRPQVGDMVAYFREGHLDFWASPNRCSRLNEKTLPYVQIPNLAVAVFGRVVSITYALCRFQTLEELDTENPTQRELTRRYIQVQYHNCDGIPDFIILYSRYRASLQRTLSRGDSVSVLFDGDQIHNAEIIGFKDIKPTARHASMTRQIARNPWKSITVRWTEEEESAVESNTEGDTRTEQVSPWELAHDQGVDSKIHETEKSALLEIIDDLRSNEEFVWFVTNVDYANDYPDYLQSVAYPMCLDTITERLESGFYRYPSAVTFDMVLIKENAEIYNKGGTPVPVAARLLLETYKSKFNHRLGDNGEDMSDIEQASPSRRLRRQSSATNNGHAKPLTPSRKRKAPASGAATRRSSRNRRRRLSNGSAASDGSDYMAEDNNEEEDDEFDSAEGEDDDDDELYD
ncbi:hypothetical protein FBU59_002873 [Linderina macrospora]|uniref:Uncharacterized protein n=1 Tax=Linderina macrospora TaxID=4868 RepID=A0ACC1J9Y5_9FUNG|nr:hypothetical protein FBU59_002873 [Linderina macrospora]